MSFFDNVKRKKKVEILLKVIERVYTKNPEMQKLIGESMMQRKMCHPSIYFFLFFDGFINMGYLNIHFLCAKGTL